MEAAALRHDLSQGILQRLAAQPRARPPAMLAASERALGTQRVAATAQRPPARAGRPPTAYTVRRAPSRARSQRLLLVGLRSCLDSRCRRVRGHLLAVSLHWRGSADPQGLREPLPRLVGDTLLVRDQAPRVPAALRRGQGDGPRRVRGRLLGRGVRPERTASPRRSVCCRLLLPERPPLRTVLPGDHYV